MPIKKAADVPQGVSSADAPASVTGSSTPESTAKVELSDHGESFTQQCIRRSGAIQAAVGSPIVAAYSTNWEDAKAKAIEMAEHMLKWIERR